MSEVLDREDFLKIAQQFGDKATIEKILSDPNYTPWLTEEQKYEKNAKYILYIVEYQRLTYLEEIINNKSMNIERIDKVKVSICISKEKLNEKDLLILPDNWTVIGYTEKYYLNELSEGYDFYII